MRKDSGARWHLMEEAKSLVDAGNLHLAAARMEEARELRPSDDRLLFRLASLYYDLQRYDLAAELCAGGDLAGAFGVAVSLSRGTAAKGGGQVAAGSRTVWRRRRG